MIEIGLILGINIAGLGCALLLARWVLARDPGSAESRRIAGAVRRAAQQLLWREYRLVAAGVLGIAVLAFAVHGYLAHSGKAPGSIESAFWTTVAVGLGAACTCAAAHAGALLALGASPRTVAAARVGLDRALGVAVRAGGAVALMTQALCSLGVLLLFGLVFAMKGGLKLAPAEAATLGAYVASILPGFAVGAAAAALVLQRGGATFHVASDVGADVAGERDAGLEHDDPRNPAVVADLVGDSVGLAAVRAADLFASSAVASVTAVYLAARLLAATPDQAAALLALVALPLVIHAFGIIASAFGVIATRADEPGNPAAAVHRGHATTAVIALGSIAGAALWLLGEQYWFRFFSAGAIGLGAAAAVAYAARYRTARGMTPLREVLDSLRIGDPGAVGHGLGLGLEAAVLPMAVVGAAIAAAWQLGVGSGLVGGGLVAAATALMAMLGAAPYVLAVGTLGPIVDNARGILSMAPAGATGDTQQRTGRLDDAAFGTATMSQTYLIVVGCSSALFVAITLHAPPGGSAALSPPVVLGTAALGVGVVLAYAGSAIRVSMRGARAVALEVERQLRGFPRERGMAKVPRDYTPSYRSCIDLTARAATRGLLAPIAAVVLVPPVLALCLDLAYRTGSPGVAFESLVSFAVATALTGFAAALVADGVRGSLGAARRAARPRGSVSGFAAAVSGDAIADLLGNAAGPAAHLLVKLAAVACLAVAPFLT